MVANRVKVDAADIERGMYVAQLDRSWLETPFLFQGFEVKEDEDISQLRKYCQHVFVDISRSSLAAEEIAKRMVSSGSSNSNTLAGQSVYERTGTVKAEAPKAKASYLNAAKVMQNVMDHVRDGGAIDPDSVRAAVSPMIDSVLRNPDALAYFTSLRKQDEYSYNHSIATSVWAVVFGRHLGLDEDSLDKLALGCILLDIGKVRIPRELLRKTSSLSKQEATLMCQHVEFSLDIARKSHGLGKEVLDMIATHHERHDGSGYPNGLIGDKIPVFGRIAGIVDCYDAMVSSRPYADARSTYDAIRELNKLSGTLFQKELVEQFVQALGMFPTGSVVELNTGEVGIVVEQNKVRRLRPKVMLVLDEDKQPVSKHRVVDLRDMSSDAADEKSRFIDRGHEPGAFGIDPKDYFL